MEGSGLVTKAKFEPIGDILSPEVAFVQAARALDVAGMLAQRREDIEGLANVAALYIELSGRMMGGAPDDEDEEVDHEALARKRPLGFAPDPGPEIIPVELEEEEVPDEPVD
jgi:hypothetical protein